MNFPRPPETIGVLPLYLEYTRGQRKKQPSPARRDNDLASVFEFRNVYLHHEET